jgi:hypothetical protein
LGFFLGIWGGRGGRGFYFNFKEKKVPKWFPMVPIAPHFHPICFEFGVLLINFGN